jgi:hypothetical protein
MIAQVRGSLFSLVFCKIKLFSGHFEPWWEVQHPKAKDLQRPIFISAKNASTINILANIIISTRQSYPKEARKISSQATICILVSILKGQKTPFLQEFLQKLTQIEYPDHLITWTFVVSHQQQQQQQKGDKILPKNAKLFNNFQKGLASCTKSSSTNFVFFIDSNTHLEDPLVLKDLLSSNSSIVAPMLRTNFNIWHHWRYWDLGWNNTGTDSSPFHTTAAEAPSGI